MPAGYTGKPLAQKLGIRPSTVVAAIGAPDGYVGLLGPLPPGVAIVKASARGSTFVHLFVSSRAALAKRLKVCRKTIAQDGVVWVSWPKKSSKVPTDITEDTIRAVALPLGFVDTKVCAVDETWSGLKLVIRATERR